MKLVYSVFAFRQQAKSPIQVAFVANAGDVLTWAGIPRKSDELLTGYQRFKDDDRINRSIVPFFQNPANCSPTAVIIALRADTGIGRCVLANTEMPVGEVVETQLEIEMDEDAMKTDAIFEQALSYIEQRLGADAEQSEEEVSEDDDQDLDEIEDEEENGGATDISVHLGTETLAKMRDLLRDKENWVNPAFRDAIADYVKPAMVIDGQHRISAGAKFGPKGLPFMVCGLYDATWSEQVFQFTVVNIKPKKIPPSLITSIAALSLSKVEQSQLRGRLNQAGVKMTEVEIMSMVAYDDQSPFSNFIDMGVGEKSAKSDLLGYAAIKRVAKVWYTAQRNSFVQIAKSLFSTENANKARSEWRSSKIWFDFFCLFWGIVRDHYPNSYWKKYEGNRFFIGASLWALQEALLIEADGQMKSHWKVAPEASMEERVESLRVAFEDVVRTNLAYVPVDMWSVPWEKVSLDTNQGRDELRKLLSKLINDGKIEGRVAKNWKADSWFK
ncbi:hypothetical protein M6I34_11265 [Burkholderiaceae bacterium FT117]|uniref:hypothetical protein n=1 Tax=Zeimonas sediminis TaxID=2944268 RepID=UPI002342EA36|nr:hypothetical protein [Zeimonas sediminis]MCM5571085.1 hypothetical protein [Zeimonas sediminis]